MKDENTRNALAILGLPVAVALFVPLVVLAMMPFTIWNAWIIKNLYSWFAVPIGAPHLNTWHVLGLLLLINTVRRPGIGDKRGLKKTFIDSFGYAIAGLVVLIVGYLLKGHI